MFYSSAASCQAALLIIFRYKVCRACCSFMFQLSIRRSISYLTSSHVIFHPCWTKHISRPSSDGIWHKEYWDPRMDRTVFPREPPLYTLTDSFWKMCAVFFFFFTNKRNKLQTFPEVSLVFHFQLVRESMMAKYKVLESIRSRPVPLPGTQTGLRDDVLLVNKKKKNKRMRTNNFQFKKHFLKK